MPSRTQSFAQVSWKNFGLLVGYRSNQETEIVLMLQLLIFFDEIEKIEFAHASYPKSEVQSLSGSPGSEWGPNRLATGGSRTLLGCEKKMKSREHVLLKPSQVVGESRNWKRMVRGRAAKTPVNAQISGLVLQNISSSEMAAVHGDQNLLWSC